VILLTSIALIGPIAAVVAIIFMKLMIYLGTIPKKINIKPWQAPIIAGICLWFIWNVIFSEVLGLEQKHLMSVITSQNKVINICFCFLLEN
jgi:H+/Cl- antiporter ClcA